MKNVLKKIVAGTAIVSTVACLSVSAFAATASVSSDKNSVTLTDWTAGSSTNQYTVVIVPADASEINENNIYYINQDNGTGMASIVNSMGVKTALEENKTYEVRIGTDVAGATIERYQFTITPAGVKVYWGDVNGDKLIDITDVTLLRMKSTKEVNNSCLLKDDDGSTLELSVDDKVLVSKGGNSVTVKWGDVNGDKTIDISDITLLLNRQINGVSNDCLLYDNVSNSDKTLALKVGDTVTVSKKN